MLNQWFKVTKFSVKILEDSMRKNTFLHITIFFFEFSNHTNFQILIVTYIRVLHELPFIKYVANFTTSQQTVLYVNSKTQNILSSHPISILFFFLTKDKQIRILDRDDGHSQESSLRCLVSKHLPRHFLNHHSIHRPGFHFTIILWAAFTSVDFGWSLWRAQGWA